MAKAALMLIFVLVTATSASAQASQSFPCVVCFIAAALYADRRLTD